MSGNSKKISLSDFFNNLTPKKAIGIIVIVGFIVYVRSLFNGFVWDDILFILQNFSIRPLMSQSFLTHNLYNSGAFYRPVTYLYFGVLYSIFGQNAFYYHLTQLFLHIVATVLLFTFLRLFFLEWISFFLALIFLVHPMNVESIAYISATNSELCFLFGIGALQLGVKDN